MSIWADQDLEARVVEVLRDVPMNDDTHHFGRPYMTAYQVAIELTKRYPGVRQALDRPVGGAGSGQRTSLAQYLGRELSQRIQRDPHFPVEGAFISNQDVADLTYNGPDGPLASSLHDAGYELSMFRLAT